MRAHRLERIASTVRWVVSDAIANRLNDPRVSHFTSVTRVEVAGDLSVAKVHVSVMGTPAEERRTLHALRHAAGHVQRLLARRLETRQCPQLAFEIDPSLKGTAETLRLLNELIPPATDEAASPDAADGQDEAVDPEVARGSHGTSA